MTKLVDHPIKRETAVIDRRRPLVVELFDRYMTLRPKGTRQAVNVGYDVIYDYARKRHWAVEQTRKPKPTRVTTRKKGASLDGDKES